MWYGYILGVSTIITRFFWIKIHISIFAFAFIFYPQYILMWFKMHVQKNIGTPLIGVGVIVKYTPSGSPDGFGVIALNLEDCNGNGVSIQDVYDYFGHVLGLFFHPVPAPNYSRDRNTCICL